MRITGGMLRGRDVPMPRRGQVRPTSARVREALFSIIGQDLSGWSALDAFAGAGLLGLEAASRGASPVLFVDRDAAVIRHLQRSIAALASGLPGGTRLSVRRLDAAVVLKERALKLGALKEEASEEGEGHPPAGFDLVLLDPPYAEESLRWLELGAAATRRALVLEHRWGVELPPTAGPLRLHRHRRYGDTGLAVYTR